MAIGQVWNGQREKVQKRLSGGAGRNARDVYELDTPPFLPNCRYLTEKDLMNGVFSLLVCEGAPNFIIPQRGSGL